MNNLLYIILIFHLISTIDTASPITYSPQKIHKLLSLSREYQHKFEININNTFSSQSDMTVVVTSCNRLPLLKITLNSFFHFNTYILYQLIIIEDCAWNQKNIWELLPRQAANYKDWFFKVLVNKKRLGQIASIDLAYSFVKTKYVYHLEDDWAQLGTYGFLERMKDALEHAERNNIKVSQAVQTLLEWSWTHMLGPLHRSQHHTKYYTISSYGKQFLYRFSFNPHLINYQNVYRKQLSSSYIESIARRYHCINNPNTNLMENGGCVEQYAGKHFSNLSYNQIYVDIRKKPLYKHIGDRKNNYNIQSFIFQKAVSNTKKDTQPISIDIDIDKQINSLITNPSTKKTNNTNNQNLNTNIMDKQEDTSADTNSNIQKIHSYYIDNNNESNILIKVLTILVVCVLIVSVYRLGNAIINGLRGLRKRKYDVRIGYDAQ